MKINTKVYDKKTEEKGEKLESFGKFTKTEIATLFPATELLHKIHNDHLYTGTQSSDHKTDNTDDPEAEDSAHDDILSLNAFSIQEVFQRMVSMTALDTFCDLVRDNDQEVVQSTTEIDTPSRKRVTFLDEQPSTSNSYNTPARAFSSTDRVPHQQTVKPDYDHIGYKKNRKYKHRKLRPFVNTVSDKNTNSQGKTTANSQGKTTASEESVCKTVTDEEWKIANRCAEAEREMNTLIHHTAELLIRRWGEYLSMTAEQIRGFEIENAHEHKMVEEVIEMLEDKDRYVWELIEDLQFF